MANRNPVCDEIFTPSGLLCRTEDATRAAGREFADCLSPGSTVSLEGPLGAGKTHFVKGLAAALGEDPNSVSSPTFTIVHEYASGALVHFDLYRIDSPGDLDALGFHDYIGSSAICAIEWGGKFPETIPPGTLRLSFHIEGEFRRIVGSWKP